MPSTRPQSLRRLVRDYKITIDWLFVIYLHNSGQVYAYRVKRMIIPRWNVSRTKIKQWMLDENANERRESVPTPEIYVQKRSRVIRLPAFSASSSTSKEQRVYNKIMCTGISWSWSRMSDFHCFIFFHKVQKDLSATKRESIFFSWRVGGRTQAIDWLIDRQMSTIFYSLS